MRQCFEALVSVELGFIFTITWDGINLQQHTTCDFSVGSEHTRSWSRTAVVGATSKFVFTANCKGTFMEFCRYAHLFDEVVLSLDYADT